MGDASHGDDTADFSKGLFKKLNALPLARVECPFAKQRTDITHADCALCPALLK